VIIVFHALNWAVVLVLLALWLPPDAMLLLTSLQSSLLPFIESALAQMPGLAGGIATLVWVAWGIGGVLLVLLGVAGSGVIAFLSRKGKR
jgi:hypothetical protein